MVQCGYVFYFFSRILLLPRSVPILPTNERKQVSIIICAKNEAHNLKKNLPAILSQRYMNDAGKPLYEVIVVNDASTDETAKVLQQLASQYDNLCDVVIPQDVLRDMPGKKYALSKGLEYAGSEWLLLTDADCKPASDEWLGKMIQPLAAGKEIVAGYGGYNKGKGLLNAFTRWETLHTFLQYSTYTLTGKPYMGVGRNLACTKKALLKAQRSAAWKALPSGDDDLLVNIVGDADNVAIVCDADAFTYSDAKRTIPEWIKQKQRHLSTGKYYKNGVQYLLGAYALSHALIWLLFFGLLFTAHLQIVVVIMAVRCVLYWFIWATAANKFREIKLSILFPFFDIAWMMYNFAFSPYILWKNKQQWK